MICILLTWFFQTIEINLGFFPTAILAIPFAILATILLSLFFNKFVFSYYRIQRSQPVVIAMASIGVMFVINAIIRIVIGPNAVSYTHLTLPTTPYV